MRKDRCPMTSTTARALSTDDIPIIDIAPLVDGSDPDRAADQLGWAATEVGFIYVKNHGIPETLLTHARSTGLEFFRHSLEDKSQVSSNIHHHGYLRHGFLVWVTPERRFSRRCVDRGIGRASGIAKQPHR